jgi:hypothetical protein
MGLNSSNLPYSKERQLKRVRIRPTQRQKGEISTKVRKEVRERSQGVCEVCMKCNGSFAYEMAHLIGRKQIKARTTAEDLLHSCVECHRWLDSSVDGIKYKRRLVK